MRKLLAIVLVLMLILLLGPFITGLWFQYQYMKMIAFYNATGNVHINVEKYERHWMSSDALLAIEINNPTFSRSLISLGIDKEILPDKFNFSVKQHIQHGPFIYRNIQKLPSRFGLAAFHNTIYFPDDLKKFLQTFGIADSVLQPNDTYVTYAGNYAVHLIFSDLNFIRPEKPARIQMKNLDARFWIQLEVPHIQADIIVDRFLYIDKTHSLTIPAMQLRFDQHHAKDSLWTGKSDWKVSEIFWGAENSPMVNISDVHWSSDVQQSADSLWLSPRITVKKIVVDDKTLGPIRLQLTARKLNAKTINDMFAIYHQIATRGELYRSELRQRIFFLLPKLITPGSAIKLEKFDLTTSNGNFKMVAGISWPNKEFFVADDLKDLLDEGKMYVKAHASQTFVSQAIELFSSLPYFRQVPEQALKDLTMMEKSAMSAMQRNAFLLASLVDSGQISEPEAENLIELLKVDPAGEQYPDQVKQLLLGKEITLITSYQLYWSYAGIKKWVESYRQQVAQYQYAISQQLTDQFDEWLKAGFIVAHGKDYSLTMTREAGVMKFNGKKI